MNELLPLASTPTLEELIRDEALRSRHHSVFHSTSLGTARLDFEWWVTFTHPRTQTESEAREALFDLLAESSRAQCHLIVQSLPDEVAPIVLPQLRDIAEYETRMWELDQRIGIEQPEHGLLSVSLEP